MKIFCVTLILYAGQFQPGTAFPWSNFETRFARLSREAKEKGRFSMESIEELKVDMKNACAKGELKEFKGYEGFSDTFSIPTQFYYLPQASSGKEKTYFLLPQIACVEVGDGSQGPKKTYVDIPIQEIMPSIPRVQIHDPVMPAHTPGWQEFKSRFAVIFQMAKGNSGYLTIGGRISLESLKSDMILACEAGELVEVGSGSGYVEDVMVATKEYILPFSSDSSKTNLPAIDCSGSFNRKQLEKKAQQVKEDIKKRMEDAVIRAKNLEEELKRKEAVKKVYPSGWVGFKARYDVISENAYNNYGFLSLEDLTDLDLLKLEITQACTSGDIVEFGPGDDIKDELGIVVIPTKEYILSKTADSEKVVLPAVNCHESFLQGKREKEAEKSLNKLLEELLKDGLLLKM